MKSYIRTAVYCVMAFAALSCTKTPEFVVAEKGPDMVVGTYTESTYMGAVIKVPVNLKDSDFALSTVKAFLYYGETEVNAVTLRTKTEGDYEIEIQAPLLKDVPDGTATLVVRAQNVGLGITETELGVALKRPDFSTLTLVDENGATYTMNRTQPYTYEATASFPAYVNAKIQTPEFNNGEVITLGWDGSGLTSSETAELIPFGASLAGTYTLKADLVNLSVSPTGSADVVTVTEYKKGQKMEFGNVVNVENWTLDPDFFNFDKDTKAVTFRAVDGLYKMSYDTENMFIRVEPMQDADNPLKLADDGSGAVWAIGANFGKPAIGPSWNTDDGAYAAAQVADKVYEFTLAVPGQLAISGGEFKFFSEKGWGGEFSKDKYTSVDLAPAFTMADNGNISVAEVTAGKGYKIILNLTAGASAAKITYEEVEVAAGGLDITVNGAKALKVSSSVYKVPAVQVAKNSLISFSGIDNPLDWTLDQDHFSITNEGLKFNAVDGYYSFELNIDKKYVIVRHVKADGKAATYKNEGALTIMAWGVGYPMMSQQLAWESGLLLTLAQIEPGVYQFTGVACAENDDTVVGNCWRYDNISMKFFGQAGWGDEWNTVTLTDEAKKYIAQDGNVELVLDHKDDAGEKVFKPLELGKTYRMTVTNCSTVDGDGKFNVTMDFRKL